MEDLAGVVVVALLAVRWLHTLRCLRRLGVARRLRVGRIEWQAAGLFLVYLGALALWLFTVLRGGPVALGVDLRGGTAIAVAALAAFLRVAGLERLGRGYSTSSRPIAEALVTTGVYRYLKHPLIVGFGLEVLALVLVSGGPVWAAGAILALTVGFLAAQLRREERELRARFGSAWEAYARGKML